MHNNSMFHKILLCQSLREHQPAKKRKCVNDTLNYSIYQKFTQQYQYQSKTQSKVSFNHNYNTNLQPQICKSLARGYSVNVNLSISSASAIFKCGTALHDYSIHSVHCDYQYTR